MKKYIQIDEWIKCKECNGLGKVKVIKADWYCSYCGKLTDHHCNFPTKWGTRKDFCQDCKDNYNEDEDKVNGVSRGVKPLSKEEIE